MLKSLLNSYGLKVVAILAVAMGVLVFGQQATINHQREVISEQALVVEGLTRQVNADRVTIRELETVERTDRVVYRTVTNVVEQIQSAPGADTLVPDSVANAWYVGIERLRNETIPAPFSSEPYLDAGTVVSTSSSA